MSAPGLDIEVRSSRTTLTVIPRGELDIATAGRLREVLRAQEASPEAVTLDLSQLGFMDASGLSLVLEARHRSEKDGFDLRVVVGSGVARHLFELIGAGGELE